MSSPVLVIDIGTFHARVGVAGDDAPKVVRRSVVGRPVDHAERLGGHLIFPLNDGRLDDCDPVRPTTFNEDGSFSINAELMETVLEECCVVEVESSDTINVLIIEPTLTSKEYRRTIAEICYDKIGVDSLLFYRGLPLSLFATGQVSGNIADLGYSATYVGYVNNGYIVPNSVRTVPQGGRWCTSEILGVHPVVLGYGSAPFVTPEFKTWAMEGVIEALKMGTTPWAPDATSPVLPDGTRVDISDAAEKATRVILQEVTRAIGDIQEECEGDGSMTVSGGSSETLGLVGPIVQAEMPDAFFASRGSQVPWLGGSILGCLGSFELLAVQKEEYLTGGDSVLHKRSP